MSTTTSSGLLDGLPTNDLFSFFFDTPSGNPADSFSKGGSETTTTTTSTAASSLGFTTTTGADTAMPSFTDGFLLGPVSPPQTVPMSGAAGSPEAGSPSSLSFEATGIDFSDALLAAPSAHILASGQSSPLLAVTNNSNSNSNSSSNNSGSPGVPAGFAPFPAGGSPTGTGFVKETSPGSLSNNSTSSFGAVPSLPAASYGFGKSDYDSSSAGSSPLLAGLGSFASTNPNGANGFATGDFAVSNMVAAARASAALAARSVPLPHSPPLSPGDYSPANPTPSVSPPPAVVPVTKKGGRRRRNSNTAASSASSGSSTSTSSSGGNGGGSGGASRAGSSKGSNSKKVGTRKRKRNSSSDITLEEINELESKGLDAALAAAARDGVMSEDQHRKYKKQRRQIRNRESAHASRVRQKEYVAELKSTVAAFAETNSTLKRKMNVITDANKALEDEILHLRSAVKSHGSTAVAGSGSGRLSLPSAQTTGACLFVLLFSFAIVLPQMNDGAAFPYTRTPVAIPEVIPSATADRAYIGRVLSSVNMADEAAAAAGSNARSSQGMSSPLSRSTYGLELDLASTATTTTTTATNTAAANANANANANDDATTFLASRSSDGKTARLTSAALLGFERVDEPSRIWTRNGGISPSGLPAGIHNSAVNAAAAASKGKSARGVAGGVAGPVFTAATSDVNTHDDANDAAAAAAGAQLRASPDLAATLVKQPAVATALDELRSLAYASLSHQRGNMTSNATSSAASHTITIHDDSGDAIRRRASGSTGMLNSTLGSAAGPAPVNYGESTFTEDVEMTDASGSGDESGSASGSASAGGLPAKYAYDASIVCPNAAVEMTPTSAVPADMPTLTVSVPLSAVVGPQERGASASGSGSEEGGLSAADTPESMVQMKCKLLDVQVVPMYNDSLALPLAPTAGAV